MDRKTFAAQIRVHADDYSEMLQKPGFRPSQGYLEEARNLLRQAAAELEKAPDKDSIVVNTYGLPQEPALTKRETMAMHFMAAAINGYYANPELGGQFYRGPMVEEAILNADALLGALK